MIHIYANVLCVWVSIYTYNLITFQSVSSCVSGRQSVCRSPPAFSVETTLFWEPPTLSFRKRTGRDCSGWVVPLSRFLHGDPPHGVSLKAGNVFLTFLMCFLWGQSGHCVRSAGTERKLADISATWDRSRDLTQALVLYKMRIIRLISENRVKE